jgi:hypothetical protein
MANDTQLRAEEWAQNNGFQTFWNDTPQGDELTIKTGTYQYVNIGPHGNVELEMRRSLGGGGGSVDFTPRQMKVTDERGDTSVISESKFPIQTW